MTRRAVPVLPYSCASLTDGVQSLINPLRGLAILDPRPSTAAGQCERAHTLASRPCYSLLPLGSSAWGDQHGAINRADEVTLARKGAKSRTHITGLHSKTTKARTHVDRLRAANADLKKKLAESLEQQTATSGKTTAGNPCIGHTQGPGRRGRADPRGTQTVDQRAAQGADRTRQNR